jgi:hypothetical protein
MMPEHDMANTSVRFNQDLIEKTAIMAKALNRVPPKQIEHWEKFGEIMEDNESLAMCYQQCKTEPPQRLKSEPHNSH